MRRIFLLVLSIFIFCAAAKISFAAEYIDCYVGTQKISSLEVIVADGTVWMPLTEIARALNLKLEKSGDEVVLSNQNSRVRIVPDSTAAWNGRNLVALFNVPKDMSGIFWIDERSANLLFHGALKEGVSFRDSTAKNIRPEEKTKSTESVLYRTPSGVRSERPKQTTDTPHDEKWQKLVDKNKTVETPPVAPKPASVGEPVGSGLVIIDPGHGGQDPGAVGNGIREKDINLAIGLLLEKSLKTKGIKVQMTRRTDVYLRLDERTAIANKLGAEIFVSVHANALPKGKSASGFEIYIMALPTDRDALELAKFENREVVNGKINTEAADKNTQLFINKLSEEDKKKVSIILGDMKQNDKITRSTKLTESLFSSGNQMGLPMRRVAQAPFFVLRGTDNMSAVLLETGFVTDEREAKLLAHPGYQQKIADAMASGIVSYTGGK